MDESDDRELFERAGVIVRVIVLTFAASVLALTLFATILLEWR